MRLSYRRPLRTTGEVAQRKAASRQRVRTQVLTRSGTRCELCGHRTAVLEGHHVWRRGAVAGIPTVHCEAPESIVALCVNDPLTGHLGCHERIHAGDLKLEDKARVLAMERFAKRWDLPHPGDLHDELAGRFDDKFGVGNLDVMRELVRRLEERTGA